MVLPPTPAQLGFRMPAEWEPHAATWLAWPHQEDDWPGKFDAIPWVYAEIVRLLHRSELVRILVNDAEHEDKARRVLSRVDLDWDSLEFQRIPTDRAWVRDYGPLFVTRDDTIALTDWQFNAWA
ncbi:MAG: agmatine deiminase family protein, partial [Planctomycetes bacterium]|nr:agmatine deiminase family protein [Planctomycetota bacterium]